jgi:hypothetical protein
MNDKLPNRHLAERNSRKVWERVLDEFSQLMHTSLAHERIYISGNCFIISSLDTFESVCASLYISFSFSVPVELSRFFSNTRELEIWIGKQGWWEFQGPLCNLRNAERKRARVCDKAREEQRAQGSEAQASGRRSGERRTKECEEGQEQRPRNSVTTVTITYRNVISENNLPTTSKMVCTSGNHDDVTVHPYRKCRSVTGRLDITGWFSDVEVGDWV